MDEALEKNIDTAIWIAKSLFSRNKTSGSSANMSFRQGNMVYITGSGSCFGNLKPEDFSSISIDGTHISGVKPSKEAPLHTMVYKAHNDVNAVIHTHSRYAVAWSCLKQLPDNVIPDYTPYLKMKLGSVVLVPYEKPGSEELFKRFEERVHLAKGFLLKNHGPLAGGNSLMDAFYNLEELEESCTISWMLRNEEADII